MESSIKKEIALENYEKRAYLYGGQMAYEYAKEIGKHDLTTFTGDEWLTFCECMCHNYHLEFAKDQLN